MEDRVISVKTLDDQEEVAEIFGIITSSVYLLSITKPVLSES